MLFYDWSLRLLYRVFLREGGPGLSWEVQTIPSPTSSLLRFPLFSRHGVSCPALRQDPTPTIEEGRGIGGSGILPPVSVLSESFEIDVLATIDRQIFRSSVRDPGRVARRLD